jgi:hypothetical protein
MNENINIQESLEETFDSLHNIIMELSDGYKKKFFQALSDKLEGLA